MRRLAIAATLALMIGVQPVATVLAADPPLELKWAALMPPVPPVAPSKLKPFFSGAIPPDDSAGPPPPPMHASQEGAFMSMKRRQPGADLPPRVIPELNGKRVRIGGYVVPLDFESTSVKEFLLVPFVGACIHVPPPPANQIVYVKAAKGFEIGGTFDPVTVTGTIKTETAFTGLADAGYSLDAETVEPRTE
jgi:hypothetical protein